MVKKKNFFNKDLTSLDYFIFLIAILICYYNTLLHPQIYYDDFVNIFSFKLVGDGFNLHSILNALKFHVGGFRPISYLSFYLNHHIFNGEIHSFIAVNVIIHYINTIIFFHIALKLTDNRKLSFFAALFWAVSPVNLFAVSYLVQRMTSLMAMFGGIGTVYYLKWEEKRDVKYLILAILFVILSTLSKESGVLFLGLFLVHYYVKNGDKKDILTLYITGFLFLVFWYFFCKNYFITGYIRRGTSPLERFFTEFRVLVFYIKNILIPFNKDIFLFIDFKASRGLFHPITTFFSLLLLLFLFAISIFSVKKDRVITLGILGFFLFHSIESTFPPLLRVFFHRNYIASFFLILAFAKIIFYLKPFFRYFVFSILILNAMWATMFHNLKWQYKTYYTELNYKSFPQSIDAETTYALSIEKQGKYQEALKLYLELLKTYNRTWPFIETVNIFQKSGFNKEAIAIANIQPEKDPEILRILGHAYGDMGDMEKAIDLFEKSLNKSFSAQKLLEFLDLLYRNEMYDKIVFETEKYQKKLKAHSTKNKILSYIFNSKIFVSKIMLIKIECKIRINLEKFIKKDIKFLKIYGIYNKKVEDYINALIDIRNKKYNRAIETLKKIRFKKMDNFSFFLNFKRTVFLLCLYDKIDKRKEFENLIEKYSKNPIIYSKIWRDLDKCY